MRFCDVHAREQSNNLSLQNLFQRVDARAHDELVGAQLGGGGAVPRLLHQADGDEVAEMLRRQQ